MLRFLGKMNRRTDIGVVCCTSIEHTRQGKWYTVPEYISGHDLLNCAKSIQMGFKVGGRRKPASFMVYCSTYWSSHAERCRRVTK